MFRGVYSAATGMVTASQSQEVTAHNVAHGTVPGYRQFGVVHETFEDALRASEGGAGPMLGARVAQQFTDFRPGPLQMTGAPLDLALNGDGFFAVQGPDGPLYTRDGVVQRAADGRLVSTGGYPILGTRGPITISPQASKIVFAQDGSVIVDGIPQDQLRVVRFRDPTQLRPAGTALFQAPPEAGEQPSQAAVQQGYREGSNVAFASAMVTMISDLRHFEASQRALRTISDSVALVTRAV
jgi:flagellar basal body rod protein FlgG